MTGTFPYYSDGKEGEKYGTGDYKATNGRLYKVSTSGTGTPLAWYPAPGYRNNTSGALTGAGDHGASWSSSFSQTSVLYLALRPYYLNPSTANVRAFGFQLRCLSEERNTRRFLMAASILRVGRPGEPQ